MIKKSMRNKHLLCLLLIVIFILAAVTAVLFSGGYQAGEAAKAALKSDEEITVTMLERGYAIGPEGAGRGLIFYPGGRVDHTAYAPLLRQLAGEGWLCIVPEMPLDLAVLDMDAADGYFSLYPEIEKWYIGGHSLGGAMAASYAADHTEELEGLLLFAAYSTEDLSQTDLEVYSIYGSEDRVLNQDKYAEYFGNLPGDVHELVIDGGCHANFGDYGPQSGDGEPSITAMEQVEIAVEYVVGG